MSETPMPVRHCPDAACRSANRCTQGMYQDPRSLGNACEVYDGSQGLDHKQHQISALYAHNADAALREAAQALANRFVLKVHANNQHHVIANAGDFDTESPEAVHAFMLAWLHEHAVMLSALRSPATGGAER